MNWQLALVGFLVAVSALYLLRKSWRTWFPSSSGCGGGCGCSKKMDKADKAAGRQNTLIPLEELTLRKRD